MADSNKQVQIDIYHFGIQCPWFECTSNNLREFSDTNNYDFFETDIQRSDINTKDHCYFPFNTAVNSEMLTGSPIFNSNISDLFSCSCRDIIAKSDFIKNAVVDYILPISDLTIKDSISVCTNYSDIPNSKIQWYNDNKNILFGFIGYKDNSPISIIEYINSLECKYPGVTKDQNNAFILCSYSNNPIFDYRYDLIKCVIQELDNKKYKTLEIIVGKNSYYPNGTKQYFEELGFKSIKYLENTYLLNNGSDELYLMQYSI